MADQVDVVAGERDMGGTMRLGAYPAKLVPGSLVAEAYGRAEVSERHRHRYEVNNDYRDRLRGAGLVVSGTSPDGRLVEYVELPRELHPFFVGTQAHPEFKSRPTRPQPLFRAFVARRAGLRGGRAAAGRRSASCAPAGTRPTTMDGRCAGVAGVTDFDTVSSRTVYTGHVLTLRADEVRMPGGEVEGPRGGRAARRGRHRRAGREDRVVLIRQYRHPVGDWLIELPAGLLDVPGEKAYAAAARELAEEVALPRRRWDRWSTCATRRACPPRRCGLPARDSRGARPTAAGARGADLERRPLDEAAAVFTGEIALASPRSPPRLARACWRRAPVHRTGPTAAGRGARPRRGQRDRLSAAPRVVAAPTRGVVRARHRLHCGGVARGAARSATERNGS